MGNRKLLKWLGWGIIVLFGPPLLISIYIAWSGGHSWLIYHKPKFQCRILDIETKQPIEGAVVVLYYETSTLRPLDGPGSKLIHVTESLTDKHGYFKIPAYTTFIQPLSWESNVYFTIYKQGYTSISVSPIENILSGRRNVQIKYISGANRDKLTVIDGANKTITLSRLYTTEDRLLSLVNRYSIDRFISQQSILKGLIDNEVYLLNK